MRGIPLRFLLIAAAALLAVGSRRGSGACADADRRTWESRSSSTIICPTRPAWPARPATRRRSDSPGPFGDINAGGAVYPGAIPTRFGNRKPPAAAYASGPILHFDVDDGVWEGGTFWDGRATGWRLGDPLAEQAQGPFLNPVEQNMAGPEAVCMAIQASPYAYLFDVVWGPGSLDCGAGIAGPTRRSPARSPRTRGRYEVNPFTSKYDRYLAGDDRLTGQEKKGLAPVRRQGEVLAVPPQPAGRRRRARRCSPTSPTTTSACRRTR